MKKFHQRSFAPEKALRSLEASEFRP
jgi:hypothetical protein